MLGMEKTIKIYLPEETFKTYIKDCQNMVAQSVEGAISFVNSRKNSLVDPMYIDTLSFNDYMTIFAVEPLFMWADRFSQTTLDQVDNFVNGLRKSDDLIVSNLLYSGADIGLDRIPKDILKRLEEIASEEDLTGFKCFLVDISDFEFGYEADRKIRKGDEK